MKKLHLLALILLVLSFLAPARALAATNLFSLDELTVHVYWNEDGTSAIDYEFVFTNDPSASPIDYVDVGLPNDNFNENDIIADVDGQTLTDISRSGYQGTSSSGGSNQGARGKASPVIIGRAHEWTGPLVKRSAGDSPSAPPKTTKGLTERSALFVFGRTGIVPKGV